MLVHQALLVLAVAALLGAATRVAARAFAGSPLDQLLAAIPLAASFAVCWTLLLGRIGLSGSSVALAAGPVAAWLAARLLIAEPAGLLAYCQEWWNRASRSGRTVAVALLGLAGGCALQVAHQPALGTDALAYHLADVVGWVHSGHAGAVQRFSYDLPEGYYPVTGEVLLTWGLGISRSLAPLAIWPSAVLATVLLALWRLLDALRVPRGTAIAALAAVGTLPLAAVGLNLIAPGTDLPALMWLACTAALCARAPGQPAVLGPALVAAGLGAGTKTTVVPLELVLLGTAAWFARGRLRPAMRWIGGGAAGALLVGAPWYVRNWVVHGWPLWPFSSGPTGDPLPRVISLFHGSFLQGPVTAVRGLGDLYVRTIGGGLALIAGVLAIPFVTRSRAALATAALAVGSLLVWAAAPFTGLAPDPRFRILAISTVRYMLPALAACAVALAVAARDAGAVWRRLVILLLFGASVWSLIADLDLGYPSVPRLQYLLVGGLAGAAAGALAPRTRHRLVPRLASVGTAVIVTAFLVASTPGWLGRESADGSYSDAVLAFMMRQPGFASGRQPISFAPTVLASLAGARFEHPIELIPADEVCPRIRARARSGWVVIFPGEYERGITTPFDAYTCLRGERPLFAQGGAVIYGPAA